MPKQQRPQLSLLVRWPGIHTVRPTKYATGIFLCLLRCQVRTALRRCWVPPLNQQGNLGRLIRTNQERMLGKDVEPIGSTSLPSAVSATLAATLGAHRQADN